MKRLFLFSLVSLMLFSMTGCSKKDIPDNVVINRDDSLVGEDYVVDEDIENIESSTDNDEKEEVVSEDNIVIEPENNTSEEEPTVEQEDIHTDEVVTQSVDINLVKSIITNLLSSTSQSDIDTFLSGVLKTDDFVFSPVVNKSTNVHIENIGVNYGNPNEYLGIVTLRQDGGISKFSVKVTFKDSKLSSFTYTKF